MVVQYPEKVVTTALDGVLSKSRLTWNYLAIQAHFQQQQVLGIGNLVSLCISGIVHYRKLLLCHIGNTFVNSLRIL